MLEFFERPKILKGLETTQTLSINTGVQESQAALKAEMKVRHAPHTDTLQQTDVAMREFFLFFNALQKKSNYKR